MVRRMRAEINELRRELQASQERNDGLQERNADLEQECRIMRELCAAAGVACREAVFAQRHREAFAEVFHAHPLGVTVTAAQALVAQPIPYLIAELTGYAFHLSVVCTEVFSVYRTLAFEMPWAFGLFRCTATFNAGDSTVRELLVIDDHRLVSRDLNGTLRIWNVFTAECIATLAGPRPMLLGTGPLAKLQGDRLAEGAGEVINVWDVATADRVLEVSAGGTVLNLTTLHSNRALVSGLRGGTVKVWDSAAWDCVAVLTDHLEHHDLVGMLLPLIALRADRLAIAAIDSSVRVWDLWADKCSVLKGHGGRVTCLLELATECFVSGSEDHTIRLWDPVTETCSLVFEGHEDTVTCLAVLEGNRFASGGDDWSIRVWDATTGHLVVTFDGGGEVTALCVLGTNCLASGSVRIEIINGVYSSGGAVEVWDCMTGKRITNLQQNRDPHYALACFGESRLVSGMQGEVRVWTQGWNSDLRIRGQGWHSAVTLPPQLHPRFAEFQSFESIESFMSVSPR
jgi:hypothetical protein